MFNIKIINQYFKSKRKLEIYAISRDSNEANADPQEATEQKLQELFHQVEVDTTEIDEHPPSPIVILE